MRWGGDPALQTRGARKLVVRELDPDQEPIVSEARWRPVSPLRRLPALVMADTDDAVFTQDAKQTTPRHQAGTEIHALLENGR